MPQMHRNPWENMASALLLVPRRCTTHGAAYESAWRTERSPVPVYLGAVHWDATEGLQLDVDRYGTIVELRVDGVVAETSDPGMRPAGLTLAPEGHSIAMALEIRHMKGTIERVLKGDAPVGPVEFPVVAFENQIWQPALRWGGWNGDQQDANPVTSGHALLFLPTPQVADEADFGCVEGHVVRIQEGRGQQYLRDIRNVTESMRSGLGVRDTLTAGTAHGLLEGGGLSAGYYVAEHAGWRVAMGELQEPGAAGAGASHAQLGLVEGLLRMRSLVGSGHYHARGWEQVEWRSLDRALLAWAIASLAAPGGPELDEAIVAFQVLTEGICLGTASTVEELGLPRGVVDKAIAWLTTPRLARTGSSTFGQAPSIFRSPWLTAILVVWLRGNLPQSRRSMTYPGPLWRYSLPDKRLGYDSESDLVVRPINACCGDTCPSARAGVEEEN